jgi:hypothetical protein
MDINEDIKESFQVSLDESNNIIDVSILKYDVSDSALRANLIEEQINDILNRKICHSFMQ